ncbi:MAG: hypothetical protein GWO16_00540, partial [Gammaproteobacteria bacterium]|nr:hypothetical protein [Gammaproteobacteria bacterium]
EALLADAREMVATANSKLDNSWLLVAVVLAVGAIVVLGILFLQARGIRRALEELIDTLAQTSGQVGAATEQVAGASEALAGT